MLMWRILTYKIWSYYCVHIHETAITDAKWGIMQTSKPTQSMVSEIIHELREYICYVVNYKWFTVNAIKLHSFIYTEFFYDSFVSWPSATKYYLGLLSNWESEPYIYIIVLTIQWNKYFTSFVSDLHLGFVIFLILPVSNLSCLALVYPKILYILCTITVISCSIYS